MKKSIIILFAIINLLLAIDLDSLRAVYQAENPPIIKQARPRGGGAKTYEVKEEVYIDKELHETTDGYWVIQGIELYKKDKINFESFFNGVANIRINNELKQFSLGDSVEVGNFILKERDIITKEFTGNVLKNRPYKGKIFQIGARYIYIEHYEPLSAIKLRPNLEPRIVDRW